MRLTSIENLLLQVGLVGKLDVEMKSLTTVSSISHNTDTPYLVTQYYPPTSSVTGFNHSGEAESAAVFR